MKKKVFAVQQPAAQDKERGQKMVKTVGKTIFEEKIMGNIDEDTKEVAVSPELFRELKEESLFDPDRHHLGHALFYKSIKGFAPEMVIETSYGPIPFKVRVEE